MVIGFLVSLLLFAPFAYFLTRGVVSHTQQTRQPLMGALFLFLALLAGLSLLGFALLAATSMLGFAVTVGSDALISGTTNAQPGVVTLLGTVLLFLYGIFGIFTGPVCAFLTAKIMGIVGLVVALVKPDERLSLTWLPVVAAGVTLFAMWPFTLYLTLGL